ncbi:MAG: methionyl-tRNA formyltransferase [Bacteroidia bacterium]
MRIIFMGTPEFAVPCLEKLINNNYNIVAVVTAPDKAAGRGQQLQSSAVKQFALTHGLKILQPENLKDEKFISELRELKPDLQLVVAFRMLPEAVWNMPPLGTYNLHASLLPKYRGAAPINWAIINGDTESGVTTFRLQHEIDTGNILMNEKVKLTDKTTAGELYETLMQVGAELLLKTVKKIEDSFINGIPLQFIKQDDSLATHAPKIFKETCKINWNKNVNEVYNLIRGLSPYPGSYTELNQDNKLLTLKIFSAEKEFEDSGETNGSLITDNKTYLKIKCNGGYINITELQLQGKKRMKTIEFLRGFTIKSKQALF